MYKKGFTMVEILITVVIIGILATIAIPFISNIMEDAAARTCQTNLEAIKAGLDIYIQERGVVPAVISEVPPSYWQKGFAIVFAGKDGWKKQLLYRITAIKERGLAYAQLSINDLVNGNLALMTCPKDKTPPSTGGRSYCLNEGLKNMSYTDYQRLSPDTILVYDCEDNSLAFDFRHKRFVGTTQEKQAQGIIPTGYTIKIKSTQPTEGNSNKKQSQSTTLNPTRSTEIGTSLQQPTGATTINDETACKNTCYQIFRRYRLPVSFKIDCDRKCSEYKDTASQSDKDNNNK
ncbi:MAG: prepilin-type N-terminal cleavage/methylation domain-containing protein [Candidatus Omnitrophica bacterium]|nr:prepilin-type N-terminal cleavage/methylation domain-containing protein [Candidatus Omnitrophota bacterium]